MNYEGIEAHAVNTACVLAYKMCYSSWFNNYEREDIKQELIIEYLIKIKGYDETKGERKTYINAIMVNKARDMLRSRKAKKRGQNCEVLMEFESDFYDEKNLVEAFENKYDVAKIMGFLNVDEKALCLCLMQDMSINETIKKCNIGKSKFYRILKRIREKLVTS
ncbi:MAG: RNA polymerase sigma factor [Alphaproteobacteria bacterium]